jgi:hypothetical protein
MITDKERLDWLQEGNEVIVLIAENKKGISFTTNFSQQDWTEFESVRDAIDFAIQNGKIWKRKS